MINNQHIRKLLPLGIFFGALAIFALMIITQPNAKMGPLTEKVWTVTAIKAEPGVLTPNLLLYGLVESPRHTRITAGITADVTQKPVDEGDEAIKDQLLVQLDNRDVTLTLEQREAETKSLAAQIAAEHVRHKADQKSLAHEKELVDIAKREVKRREHLYKTHVGSEADLDTAKRNLAQQELIVTSRQQAVDDHVNRLTNLESQHKRANALMEQAQIDLKRSEIRAPFDGKVAKIFVAVGNRVRPGDQIAEVYDNTALEIRTQIPTQFLHHVRNAMETHKRLQATSHIDGKTINLQLDRLASKIEVGKAGVDALFDVTSNEEYLEIGKSITTLLNLAPEENVIAIPSSGLYGLDKVYVVKDNRLVGIDVERVGSINQPDGTQDMIIRSPNIKKGDLIITTQLPNAMTGLKVRVTDHLSPSGRGRPKGPGEGDSKAP